MNIRIGVLNTAISTLAVFLQIICRNVIAAAALGKYDRGLQIGE